MAYSKGDTHTSTNYRDVDVIYTDDGETWSTPATIVTETDIQWRSPSIGVDLDGALLLWASDATNDDRHVLMRLTPGTTTWTLVDEFSFSPWPTQIGGPAKANETTLVCVGNRSADGEVYGLVSEDNGATWTQSLIWTQFSPNHIVEFRIGCSIGGGKVLFLGRGNADVGIWQIIYDSESGTWSDAELTNIDDAYDQPVYPTRRGNWVDIWYSSRFDGYIRVRSTPLDNITTSPLFYLSPKTFAAAEITVNDSGYVCAIPTPNRGTDVCWYSGTASVTTIYHVALSD